MESSCIDHPAKEPLIIVRQWQLVACDGDRTAAALMSFFEYWHNVKLDHARQAKVYNRTAEKHGDEPTQYDGLVQWHTTEDIERGILIFKASSIAKGIAILVEKGFLSVFKNPNPRYAFDKTRHFLFLAENVNDWLSRYKNGEIDRELKNKGSCRENTSRSIENTSRPIENTGAIPETTSETTSETTLSERASERKNFPIDDESDRQTEKDAEPKTDRPPIRTVDPNLETEIDRPTTTGQPRTNCSIEPEIVRETIYSAPATVEPVKREPKSDRFFGQRGNQLEREKRRAEQRMIGDVFLKYPRPAEAERDFYEKAIAYFRANSDPGKVHPGSIEAFATAALNRVNRGVPEPRDTLLIEQWERGELDRYEGARYDPSATKADALTDKTSTAIDRLKSKYGRSAS